MPRLAPSLVLSALLAFSAVAMGAGKPEAPLATLGNKVIREADFRRYLEGAYPAEQLREIDRSPSSRQGALEAYLDFVAVVAKARREGIDQETRFKKALWLMEVKALAHLMTERHRDRILRASQVSAKEVKSYYEQHKSELTVEPHFTAHHLLVYVRGNPAFPEKGLGDAEARARAGQALAELRAGRSWEVVAKTYSDEIVAGKTGGLIRDGRFGYFAPEVEQAVKAQELGKPGGVVRSAFGYHVLQVDERVTERAPQPFEKVKEVLMDRLSQQRSAQVRKAFMEPISREVGFKWKEAGTRDASLLDEKAVAPAESLAEIGGKSVLESDFQWFVRDALMPPQRMSAFSRPGARRSMLNSFLDMLILEAKARRDGMDKTPEFARSRASMEDNLLSEFVQERDKAGASCQSGKADEERRRAQRGYYERVRAEVGLQLAGGSK